MNKRALFGVALVAAACASPGRNGAFSGLAEPLDVDETHLEWAFASSVASIIRQAEAEGEVCVGVWNGSSVDDVPTRVLGLVENPSVVSWAECPSRFAGSLVMLDSLGRPPQPPADHVEPVHLFLRHVIPDFEGGPTLIFDYGIGGSGRYYRCPLGSPSREPVPCDQSGRWIG